MKLDLPIHALIELVQPRRDHYQLFRRIQGEESHIACMLSHACKRKPSTARELLVMLDGARKGPIPELLDSTDDLTQAQIAQTRRYVVTFSPTPYIEVFKSMDNPEVLFRGPLAAFVSHYESDEKSPSERARYQRQLERQRRRRALKRIAKLKPAATLRGRHGPPPTNLPRQPESFEARALAKLLTEESPRTLRNALVKKHR